jgi:two-component sensor histidine kinase
LNQAKWLGTLSIGIGILGFLLYRLFGQKKQIEFQNRSISIALSEKDTLLREIHHGVKNNLQVISSLLRIQSSHTEDAVALDALKEGQSRVQSMSLIHQDLYERDNLAGIRMQTLLSRLSQNLFDTYNISRDRIEWATDIAHIHLDVETVVPLGLVINELVTNSLKYNELVTNSLRYAFTGDSKGVIEIELSGINDVLVLVVKDNGIGISDPDHIIEGDSFGYSFINVFANKLDADLSLEGGEGAKVILKIRDYKKIV